MKQINWMKHLLTLKPKIIANSDETKKYLNRFAEDNDREYSEILTAYIGVEPCFLNQAKNLPSKSGKKIILLLLPQSSQEKTIYYY